MPLVLPPRPERGFTLVELLVTVGLIILLAGLASAWISSAQRGALTAQTTGNMRQWGVALRLYASEQNGTLPGPAFVNIDRRLNRGRIGMAERRQMTTLFAYLYPYLNPGWVTAMPVSDWYYPKVAACPVTASAGPDNPMQHFIRTVTAGAQPDPFGYTFADPAQSRHPLKAASLAMLHSRPESRIPMISTLDKQNSNVGSGDGFSPAKAAHHGRRAYLFFDGHTELIPVPPDAKYGDQVVPGYRN